MKRLGASCDWTRERFTMDSGLSRAVREVFVRLFEEGLIYRGDYIINWCPRCKTAFSDVEVEHEETKGHLYYIKIPFRGRLRVGHRGDDEARDDARGHRPWRSTRKTTRYSAAHRQGTGPAPSERKIPLIGDPYVDVSFGTGALKITPGHDFNDFEIGKKHNLQVMKVIDDGGSMNEHAGSYKGMDRFDARERIVEDLRAEGPAGKDRRLCAHGREVLPLQDRGRADGLAPVVRPHETARRARNSRGARPARGDHPRDVGKGLFRVDGEHQGLVHIPADMVGPPNPRLVLR